MTREGLAESAQEVQDMLGFVVLAYTIREEFEQEKQTRIVRGETVNSKSISDEAVMRVIGEASVDDWRRQCDLCGDLWHTPHEDPYIGYLRVVAE